MRTIHVIAIVQALLAVAADNAVIAALLSLLACLCLLEAGHQDRKAAAVIRAVDEELARR